ncbi:transcriptional regulator, LacI family [Tessaracoccus bendigoensis DSM 12906]|uniref:Transcriptional regulator, LacI family n=1 Tax=Tessaracoccus bendigoensis DSM 12906 TaxID=1123357 RepID=A0A1M6B9C4_9ACTN|nr:transcriptional regulator, LacI family [Tessaracoccus bendigoensis DSM 12906]
MRVPRWQNWWRRVSIDGVNRPTIRDIAKAAGISPGAASFALNDRDGVSEETRAKVKRIADEMGWTRNVAAVALSARQARAVGLVIARSEESFTGERFFMQFIAGVERILSARSRNLVLRFATSVEEEVDTYRQWWAEHRVDGVILTDPRDDDPRPTLLADLQLPGVVVGAQSQSTLPTLRVNDGAAMERLVDHFADLGHRRLAHVSGSPDLLHTQRRREAFEKRCEERGVVALPPSSTDFSEESGRAATWALISSQEPPTGIIFDNEVLVFGGVVAIVEASLSIPDQVAIATFEDTPMCRIVRPQITAMVRDPAELGRHAAEALLDAIDGRPVSGRTEPTMELIVRGSTDPEA